MGRLDNIGMNSLVVLILATFFSGCRNAESGNSDPAFDASMQADVAKSLQSLSPEERREICSKNTLIVFVGNKEKLGKEQYVNGVVEDEAMKEKLHKDFMSSVDKAQAALVSHIKDQSLLEKVCAKKTNLNLLSIVDGEQNGDSEIILSTQSADFKYNRDLKLDNSKFEISFADDLSKILDKVMKDEALKDKIATIDNVFYLFKTHGGVVQLDNGKKAHILLFDSNGDVNDPKNLAKIYYNNLHTVKSVRALCSKLQLSSEEQLFCDKNDFFDPRMSGIGGGNGSGGFGNGSGGFGNGSGGFGNGSGVGANSSGPKGTGNSSGVGANSSGPPPGPLSGIDLLTFKAPNLTDPARYSVDLKLDTAQGSLQLARGTYYTNDKASQKQMDAAGMTALSLPKPKGSKEPMMVVMDSCVQSGEDLNSALGGGPLITFSSKSPIYYHALQYEFTDNVMLKFLPYLMFKGHLDLTRRVIDEQNLRGVYGVQARGFKVEDRTLVCTRSGCKEP